MIPCDPCQAIQAENKLLRQFVAKLMEMLAMSRVVLTVDKSSAVHYLPTASDAWEVTSD